MIWKTTFLCCLISFTLCACKGKKATEKKEQTPAARNQQIRVEGHVVKTSVTNENLEVPGTLLPYEETEIHPEVPGKIIALRFTEGSNVGRGALLAKIFDGDLQAQKRKLQVQLSTSQKTQERQNELLKINAISQQDYDLAMLQTSSYLADIQILNAEIARTEIRAPFSGKVGFRNVSIGAYITPATIITTIKQLNQLKLTFSIPERYANRVVKGDNITFTVEGTEGSYSAKIMATESGITEATRSLNVKAVVEKVDKFITSGSFAKVIFNLGEDAASIMVPSQAVLPQARGKKVIVYKGGNVEFRTVVTGLRDSANVQITSGLAVGDTIITTGLLTVKPGGKVQLARVK